MEPVTSVTPRWRLNATSDGVAHYVYVTDPGPAFDRQVFRTHEVRQNELFVDVSTDGRILGIERIGAMIDADTLYDVLRWIRVAQHDEAAIAAHEA